MALNARQQLFVAYYLKHKSATQAAKDAGYSHESAHAIGPKLLEHVGVKAEIDKGIRSLTEMLGIGPEYVLGSLKAVAERCQQGTPVEEWDPIAKEMVKTGEWKFEHAGANKALELIGKYQKLFTEKIEVEETGISTLIVGLLDESE